MPYFIFSTVALIIHIIINITMFYKKNTTLAMKSYRLFLVSVALFYVTDIFWGVFYENKMVSPLYVDTVIYFITMGLTVFFWSIFVIDYLQWRNKAFEWSIKLSGLAILATEIVLLIVNGFNPIFFIINESTGAFEPLICRRLTFYIQALFYAILTFYAVIYSNVVKNKNYKRHLALAIFSVIMFICIALQIYNPLIPYYPIGSLIGICFLDFYVINEQRERFKTAYQETSKLVHENEEKLSEVLELAYKDPLTGVNNKHSFVELEEEYDRLIVTHTVDEFVVVVFDLNGLKIVNDTLGHNAGDKYIIDSVGVISEYFPFDSIYRFGGDEFVVVLRDVDYTDINKKHTEFMRVIDKNVNTKYPVIASGISRYKKNSDNTFKSVFYRADKMMYSRKEYLKEHTD